MSHAAPHVGYARCKIDARRSAQAEHPTTSPQQRPTVATSRRRSHRRLPPCDRCATTTSKRKANSQCIPDSRPKQALPQPEGSAQQHRCLDGRLPETASANDGSACSMPSRDGGRTRYVPNRSLGTNLPPAQSPRDHDDELQLQPLRS